VRAQEFPWLWFTLPELGFPMIIDECHRPLHAEAEDFLRRSIAEEQDWDAVDGDECWGSEYISPSIDMVHQIKALLLTWGGKNPPEREAIMERVLPKWERFSVPHTSRDPEMLPDINLTGDNISNLLKKNPAMGAVCIFKKSESWDTCKRVLKDFR